MTAPVQQTTRRQLDFGDLPPESWFENPNLPMLTPLTVTREGRAFGHLAGWGVLHRGLAGNIYAPRSRTNYARFVNKTAVVAGADGEPRMIPAANLTMDTKHASMTASLADASNHYDHSGTIFAQVVVFEDEFGIAYSGAVLPDATPAQLRRALACAGSGDWRHHTPTRNLELCAALLVPCEGFEQVVPRARVASGAPRALVAAGMVMPRHASFGRAVDPAWSAPSGPPAPPSPLVSDPINSLSLGRIEMGPAGEIRMYPPTADNYATIPRTPSPADLAALIDKRLDERREAAELAAVHAALAAEADETPQLVAALLAASDDTPGEVASLLADLDETPGQVEALLASLDEGDADPKELSV